MTQQVWPHRGIGWLEDFELGVFTFFHLNVCGLSMMFSNKKKEYMKLSVIIIYIVMSVIMILL